MAPLYTIMNWFLTFLTRDGTNSLVNEEDFEIFSSEVDDLVHIWLKKYIDIYKPGYTFDEVANSIWSITVLDKTIEFTFFNPYINIYESFGFWIDVLEKIQKDAKKSVLKTLYDSKYLEKKIFSVSRETVAIIQSWLPDIASTEIIDVDIIPFDDGTWNFTDHTCHNYLHVYYNGENNELKSMQLPNLFKGEYLWTANGIMNIIGIERRRVVQLLTKNNPLD